MCICIEIPISGTQDPRRQHAKGIGLRVALPSLSDNGLGLAPEQLNKLFTMFKRFHTHVERTGIGLYIVKRILENHGGRIEVESQMDKGTVFKAYIKTI